MLSVNRATLARVLPFAVFMLLLALRAQVPTDGSWGFDGRWVYGATVVIVGALLLYFARDYRELHWTEGPTRPAGSEWLLAVGVGLTVFVLWIHLDAPWMLLGEPAAAFKPVAPAGQLDWPLIVMRWCGAALLVPVMEELFWRSFLLRWIDNPDFHRVPPMRASTKAIVLSTFVFMLAHTMWLAAIVAGLAYAWLYVRSGKLWLPVIAHAVTNGALGLWVVATGHWQFW